LHNRVTDSGSLDIYWDGRSDGNNPVASGIYLIRSQSGSQLQLSKILLLR